MTRIRLLLCAALLSTPTFAFASTEASVLLAATFQNTIVSTYPDGRSARLWLDPDGQYRGEGKNGDPSSGRWQIKGEKLCFKQARPLPAPFAYCTGIIAGGVGSIWNIKSVFGEPLKVQLVAGR